jgi:hypothetical protein
MPGVAREGEIQKGLNLIAPMRIDRFDADSGPFGRDGTRAGALIMPGPGDAL